MGLKIDRGSSGRRPQRLPSRVSKQTDKVQEKSTTQFSSHMDRQFGNAQEEILRQMAKDIENQGNGWRSMWTSANLRFTNGWFRSF